MNINSALETVDGFWLPRDLRHLLPDVNFHHQAFRSGSPASPGDPGSITARWPTLEENDLRWLVGALKENRRRVPQGAQFWPRFQSALQQAGRRLADPNDPLHLQAMSAIPGYTGYAPEMIRMALHAMDWFSLDRLPHVYTHPPDAGAIGNWQPIPGAPGYIHFSSSVRWQRLASRLPAFSKKALFGPGEIPELIVGYGAGNVPGSALPIALLGLSTTLGGNSSPAVIIRNSRREPIFSPLILTAMEEADPVLMSAIAVLVWDYEDPVIQNFLFKQAGVVIAAAGDETIQQIRSGMQKAAAERPARFQAHGHKVSFSLIGREMLKSGAAGPKGETLLDVAVMLAALDSIIWDQNGCLSARVHFVEQGTPGMHVPVETYAERLVLHLRRLAKRLPRGAWPRREIHERFDLYKSLESAGLTRVFSKYDDEFLVFIDLRPPDQRLFRQLVNDCRGRTIAVRAVHDRMEIPRDFLHLLPRDNLQSLSAAVGHPGQPVDREFLDFALACAACGVTAIRSAGRGAFPQLAYSWDGWIPYDMVAQRANGFFSTIEFDNPCDELLATYHLVNNFH